MTTLNGWQRIWLLGSILWAVVILLLAGILQPDRDQTVQSALFVVRLWIVPVVAVYGFGLGLAWVRADFKSGQSSPLPDGTIHPNRIGASYCGDWVFPGLLIMPKLIAVKPLADFRISLQYTTVSRAPSTFGPCRSRGLRRLERSGVLRRSPPRVARGD